MFYLLSQSISHKSKEKLVLTCLETGNAWFNWIKCWVVSQWLLIKLFPICNALIIKHFLLNAFPLRSIYPHHQYLIKST